MSKRWLTNAGHGFGPPGIPGPGSTLTFVMVGPDAKSVIPILTSDAIAHGIIQIDVDGNGEFRVELPVNDGTTPESYYAVELRSPGLSAGAFYVERFVSILPDGIGEYAWEDFYQPTSPVDPSEWSAFIQHINDFKRHLPAGGNDGLIVGHAAGIPSWVDPAATPIEAHATTHMAGGSDELTPAALGADPAGAASSVQDDLDAHEGDINNPHLVTKNLIGLGNVDDTSDAEKPVSAATQTALDSKLATPNSPINGYTEEGIVIADGGASQNIQLDGKPRHITITEAFTMSATAPTPPTTGSSVVYLEMDATGGWPVSFAAGWLWPDAAAVDPDTTALAITRIVIVSDPSGNIHAQGDPMGVA